MLYVPVIKDEPRARYLARVTLTYLLEIQGMPGAPDLFYDNMECDSEDLIDDICEEFNINPDDESQINPDEG
jgi:hypothetical protein